MPHMIAAKYIFQPSTTMLKLPPDRFWEMPETVGTGLYQCTATAGYWVERGIVAGPQRSFISRAVGKLAGVEYSLMPRPNRLSLF